MKNTILKAGILACAIFAVTLTNAQTEKASRGEKGKKKGHMMAKADTNKDKKISLAEAQAMERGKLAENFSAIDANSDGFLVKEELKAYRKANPKPEKGTRKKRG